MRQLKIGALAIRVGRSCSNSFGGIKVVYASKDRRKSMWIFEVFIPRKLSERARRAIKRTDPVLSWGMHPGSYREWWAALQIPHLVMAIAAGMPGRKSA